MIPIVIIPGVEYDPENDELMLIRCPKCGKENYALNVLTGICTWCGYDAKKLLIKYKNKVNNEKHSENQTENQQ